MPRAITIMCLCIPLFAAVYSQARLGGVVEKIDQKYTEIVVG